MKRITIYAFNKGQTGGSMNQPIRIDGQTKEQIKEAKDEFFATVDNAYSHWWYEVEVDADDDVELTEEEKSILTELELEVDM
jgi:hypothetical protein